MPVISKITTQQKNKERYNVFIDEKYAFSIDESVLVKYQLKKGTELDDFLLSEIYYDDEIRKSYNMALRYLATRMRTEKEVRSYLLEKEVGEAIIKEVIFKLYEYQFLNDEQFAISYVRTQKNTTDKGSVVIKRELMEKGVSEKLIDQALTELSFEHQFDKAIQISEKMVQKNKKDSDVIVKQKIEQRLMRKGYPFSIIQEALSEVKIDRTDEQLNALKYQAEKYKRKYQKFTGYEYEQKMKSALFRKGFALEQIEDFLKEDMESDWE